MQKSEFLQTAIDAAKAGEAVIRRHYLGNLAVRLKEDQTPVTVADVQTEQAIKSVILDRFPDHDVYGEETGRRNTASDYLWLIDPIDGTKSFVRQYPFFSTQIALMHRDRLLAGVSNAPLFEEMAWAEAGAGAYLNNQPITVSTVSELAEATLSMGNIATLAGSSGRWARLGELVRSVNRTRGYGDFYHYHLLAAGKIDIVVESDLNILDIAALTVILREAGAEVSDLQGRTVDLDTTSLVATTPGLTRKVRQILAVPSVP